MLWKVTDDWMDKEIKAKVVFGSNLHILRIF